jgi:hypothetical protein
MTERWSLFFIVSKKILISLIVTSIAFLWQTGFDFDHFFSHYFFAFLMFKLIVLGAIYLYEFLLQSIPWSLLYSFGFSRNLFWRLLFVFDLSLVFIPVILYKII